MNEGQQTNGNGNAQTSIDQLCEILIGDDRVLDERERAFLSNLLCFLDAGDRAGVAPGIPRAVGRVALQRLLTLAGDDLARKLSDHLARVVIVDDFLAEEEAQALWHTVQSQADCFRQEQVIAPRPWTNPVEFDQHRWRLLIPSARGQPPLARYVREGMRRTLPRVFRDLRYPRPPGIAMQARVMALYHGDSFQSHPLFEQNPRAALTFVYFFHQEPQAWAGGALRVYDTRDENGQRATARTFQTLLPRQNRIAFFPSRFVHEIMPVKVLSREFAGSLFTLQGQVQV